jgi:hypothetical protein
VRHNPLSIATKDGCRDILSHNRCMALLALALDFDLASQEEQNRQSHCHLQVFRGIKDLRYC